MTRRAELEQLVIMVNRITSGDYDIDYAYGGVRLVRAKGSVDVSPRGTKAEIEEWIRAFVEGVIIGRRLGPL